METEKVCPNCGYQIRDDDIYCPSCRHRIEFTRADVVEVKQPEPLAEKVELAKSLILSSFFYFTSIAVLSFQYAYVALIGNVSASFDSALTVGSTALSGISAILLAAGSFSASRKLKGLRFPSAMTFFLGLGNLLLLIALLVIYPSSSTLTAIMNELTSSASIQQLATTYATFFALVGFAGLMGIPGCIGLILVLRRGSRSLGQPLINYGMITGIIFTFANILLVIPILLAVPPLLIIIGARRTLSVKSEFL